MNPFSLVTLEEALNFLGQLPRKDRIKVEAAMNSMRSGFTGVYTKVLRNPIRELIVKRYRLLFFIKDDKIYFVCGFTKKTQKTPIEEIEHAHKVYALIIRLE